MLVVLVGLEAHRKVHVRPGEVDRDTAVRLVPHDRHRDRPEPGEPFDETTLRALQRELPDGLPLRQQPLAAAG